MIQHQFHITAQDLLKKYDCEEDKFEQLKQTIGTIKCSQCEWSGQWGTGMIFQQIFAGELAKAGIDVREHVVDNDNLSSHTQQYTCPVCNSPGWEKV